MDNGGGLAGRIKDQQVSDITLAWVMGRLKDSTNPCFKQSFLVTDIAKFKVKLQEKYNATVKVDPKIDKNRYPIKDRA